MRDLGKLFVAKGFKRCPKCKKSPNLVTLIILVFILLYHTLMYPYDPLHLSLCILLYDSLQIPSIAILQLIKKLNFKINKFCWVVMV